MEIRNIEKHEIIQVVSIHKLAFPNFFITQLGDAFLKLFYKSLKNHKEGIMFGAYKDDRLIGFCAATIKSKGFYKKLVYSNLIEFGFVGVKLILFSPNSLIRIMRNFSKTNSEVDDRGEYAELLSIGIDPLLHGEGIGKKLLTELENLLSLNEINELSLTTDFFNNEKALGFYKSVGYEIVYDFETYPNRKMYRLLKYLDK